MTFDDLTLLGLFLQFGKPAPDTVDYELVIRCKHQHRLLEREASLVRRIAAGKTYLMVGKMGFLCARLSFCLHHGQPSPN
jgi:hypothetical protein